MVDQVSLWNSALAPPVAKEQGVREAVLADPNRFFSDSRPGFRVVQSSDHTTPTPSYLIDTQGTLRLWNNGGTRSYEQTGLVIPKGDQFAKINRLTLDASKNIPTDDGGVPLSGFGDVGIVPMKRGLPYPFTGYDAVKAGSSELKGNEERNPNSYDNGRPLKKGRGGRGMDPEYQDSAPTPQPPSVQEALEQGKRRAANKPGVPKESPKESPKIKDFLPGEDESKEPADPFDELNEFIGNFSVKSESVKSEYESGEEEFFGVPYEPSLSEKLSELESKEDALSEKVKKYRNRAISRKLDDISHKLDQYDRLAKLIEEKRDGLSRDDYERGMLHVSNIVTDSIRKSQLSMLEAIEKGDTETAELLEKNIMGYIEKLGGKFQDRLAGLESSQAEDTRKLLESVEGLNKKLKDLSMGPVDSKTQEELDRLGLENEKYSKRIESLESEKQKIEKELKDSQKLLEEKESGSKVNEAKLQQELDKRLENLNRIAALEDEKLKIQNENAKLVQERDELKKRSKDLNRDNIISDQKRRELEQKLHFQERSSEQKIKYLEEQKAKLETEFKSSKDSTESNDLKNQIDSKNQEIKKLQTQYDQDKKTLQSQLAAEKKRVQDLEDTRKFMEEERDRSDTLFANVMKERDYFKSKFNDEINSAKRMTEKKNAEIDIINQKLNSARKERDELVQKLREEERISVAAQEQVEREMEAKMEQIKRENLDLLVENERLRDVARTKRELKSRNEGEVEKLRSQLDTTVKAAEILIKSREEARDVSEKAKSRSPSPAVYTSPVRKELSPKSALLSQVEPFDESKQTAKEYVREHLNKLDTLKKNINLDRMDHYNAVKSYLRKVSTSVVKHAPEVGSTQPYKGQGGLRNMEDKDILGRVNYLKTRLDQDTAVNDTNLYWTEMIGRHRIPPLVGQVMKHNPQHDLGGDQVDYIRISSILSDQMNPPKDLLNTADEEMNVPASSTVETQPSILSRLTRPLSSVLSFISPDLEEPKKVSKRSESSSPRSLLNSIQENKELMQEQPYNMDLDTNPSVEEDVQMGDETSTPNVLAESAGGKGPVVQLFDQSNDQPSIDMSGNPVAEYFMASTDLIIQPYWDRENEDAPIPLPIRVTSGTDWQNLYPGSTLLNPNEMPPWAIPKKVTIGGMELNPAKEMRKNLSSKEEKTYEPIFEAAQTVEENEALLYQQKEWTTLMRANRNKSETDNMYRERLKKKLKQKNLSPYVRSRMEQMLQDTPEQPLRRSERLKKKK